MREVRLSRQRRFLPAAQSHEFPFLSSDEKSGTIARKESAFFGRRLNQIQRLPLLAVHRRYRKPLHHRSVPFQRKVAHQLLRQVSLLSKPQAPRSRRTHRESRVPMVDQPRISLNETTAPFRPGR